MSNNSTDTELKAKVLYSEKFYYQRKLHKELFTNPSEELTEMYFRLKYTDPEFAMAERINKAGYERKKRLAKRIAKMLPKGAIFLTITFKPETLAKTNAETRRKYVSRYLKANTSEYVANIDFGKLNGQEHYHAVVVAEKVSHKPWKEYGTVNFERIKLDGSATDKLAKYIVKITIAFTQNR